MIPRVSVIIVNWNGWQDTLECLESLYKINYPNYDVVLIDNHSTDKSLEKIKDYAKGKIKPQSSFFNSQSVNKPLEVVEYTEDEYFETPQKTNHQLFLIQNQDNYGFAGGNNRGIEFALKHLKPDYVLLLNNDTVVNKNFLTELVKVAEKNDNGFLGAKNYFYQDKNVLQTVGGGNFDPEKVIALHIGSGQIDEGQYDHDFTIDYVCGACMLCKVDMIQKIGLMDPEFFMYWEDVDWCIRGSNAGYKSVYAHKSKIWHKVSASSEDYSKEYYLHRNRIYLMKKNIKGIQYIKFIFKFFFNTFLPESKLRLVDKKDTKAFKFYFRGILAGLRKKPVQKNQIE
jgi:GT2 family glycosyltransferase